MSTPTETAHGLRPLTARQEAFCLCYMEEKTASDAYRKVYKAERMKPATVHRCAKELLDNPKIAARIEELQAGAAARNQITVDDLIAELEEARKLALAAPTPQSSAAVAATMGKAKLLGLGVDKVEMTGKDGRDLLSRRAEELTDEELLAIVAGAVPSTVEDR